MTSWHACCQQTSSPQSQLPCTPDARALRARLQREARRSGHPATEIAREAIRAALGARARKALSLCTPNLELRLGQGPSRLRATVFPPRSHLVIRIEKL